MRLTSSGLAGIGALVLLACGSGGGALVSGHIHILHGASSSLQALRAGPAGSALAADGRYYLSPDQAKVTISALTLIGEGTDVQRATLTNCTPTYSRSQTAGVELLDCPFQLPAGTYHGVSLDIAAPAQVLFDDSTNGIYTDPAVDGGLTSTRPAGGPQFATFTPSSGNTGGVFTVDDVQAPFVFGPADAGTLPDGGQALATADIYVTTDLIHTVYGYVSGGQPSFDTSLPIPVAFVHAAIGGASHEVFYTSTGTADDVFGCTSCTDDDNQSARITYGPGSDQPILLFGPQYGEVYPAAAAQSEVQPDGCKRGGFLGFDGTKICWAMPTDCRFQSYSQVCELTPASALGGTGTIECQQMSSVPNPVSGSTYASGCPAITPDYTQTLTLVAE